MHLLFEQTYSRPMWYILLEGMVNHDHSMKMFRWQAMANLNPMGESKLEAKWFQDIPVVELTA
jgi:hypothetical protein